MNDRFVVVSGNLTNSKIDNAELEQPLETFALELLAARKYCSFILFAPIIESVNRLIFLFLSAGVCAEYPRLFR